MWKYFAVPQLVNYVSLDILRIAYCALFQFHIAYPLIVLMNFCVVMTTDLYLEVLYCK